MSSHYETVILRESIIYEINKIIAIKRARSKNNISASEYEIMLENLLRIYCKSDQSIRLSKLSLIANSLCKKELHSKLKKMQIIEENRLYRNVKTIIGNDWYKY